ncbi:fatty acid-binding protein 2-like [Battus philenor]|uniref:fatty acid-binding protein 2-like n=1 Tax=Battus philenor TaxID=42288 RepID=UPI0035D0CA30
MVFLGKSYVLEKDENFENFIENLGLPSERAAFYKSQFKPIHKVEKNGNVFTLSATCPGENKQVSFKIGEEFDEKLSPKHIAKTTFTLDGNTLNQVQKFPHGCDVMYKREYFDDKLITTLTTNKWNGKAVRYYKLKA